VRYAVESWSPEYGSSLEPEAMDASTAVVDVDVEVPAASWAPYRPSGVGAAKRVLFVDGVRRIDAQVWVEEPGEPAGASPALCASYAAGVVRCDGEGAHLAAVDVRRGLFSTAVAAADVATGAGVYRANRVETRRDIAPAQALNLALQAGLAEAEVGTALATRVAGCEEEDDLLVVDGPLRGRQHLPRALGFVKSHRSTYLPPEIGGVVAALGPGERTPVFGLGSSWDRWSWYLRLPCTPGAPWAGVVRLECGAALDAAAAVALARRSQATLCRFASHGHKDARAPQNLYPIAGLERALRRRLGDAAVVYRALRGAAHRPGAVS
jgi:hypothetical protein